MNDSLVFFYISTELVHVLLLKDPGYLLFRLVPTTHDHLLWIGTNRTHAEPQPDPDPTFHFDAVPDPTPTFYICWKIRIFLLFIHSSA